MAKKQIAITVDEYIHKSALDKFPGAISSICEEALVTKTGNRIDTEEYKQCKFCGLRDFTKSDVGPGEMIWLCPDECWICDKCWKFETKKVRVAIPPF